MSRIFVVRIGNPYNITMHRREIIRFLAFRTLGNFFILLTLYGFFATFGPAVYYEAVFKISKFRGVEYAVAETTGTRTFADVLEENRGSVHHVSDSSQGLASSVLNGNKNQFLMPKDKRFSLLIPKIGASEKVHENVDPSDQVAYSSVLRNGVAHAQGTSFPGYGGNTYIFAHSTDNFWNVGRYNAVFYLLKELQPGDDITVIFMDERFDYVVTETKVVDADNLDYLRADIGQGEVLTLQTCWPPGTTWKRLLVLAKPKEL